jgi:hypothetical protein
MRASFPNSERYPDPACELAVSPGERSVPVFLNYASFSIRRSDPGVCRAIGLRIFLRDAIYGGAG